MDQGLLCAALLWMQQMWHVQQEDVQNEGYRYQQLCSSAALPTHPVSCRTPPLHHGTCLACDPAPSVRLCLATPAPPKLSLISHTRAGCCTCQDKCDISVMLLLSYWCTFHSGLMSRVPVWSSKESDHTGLLFSMGAPPQKLPAAPAASPWLPLTAQPGLAVPPQPPPRPTIPAPLA